MTENPPSMQAASRRSSRRTSARSLRDVFQSSFGRLDSFFNLDGTGDRGMSDDAESIATELRHLHDAEDELRRELDAVGLPARHSKENGIKPNEANVQGAHLEGVAVPVSVGERRTPKRRSSSFSLKQQVSDESFRDLQYKLDDIFHSLDLGSESVGCPEATDTSNAPSSNADPDTSKHPRRSLVEEDVKDNQAKESDFYSLVERIARTLFGRHEYTVKPKLTFTKERGQCVRTVQGGVVVALAAAIVASRFQYNSVLLPILLVVIPPSVTWIEINLPHRLDETTIALGVFAVHFVVSQVQ